MNRTPVVILSGFLGSGKTTLLLKMLSKSQSMGLNYAVLINERGKVDIDGLLVSKKFNNRKIESLLGGCICCSKKSEIAHSIDTLLQNKPDIIFIELTGVANPEEVANTLNEKEMIAKVELRSIITIVDAEFFLNEKSHDFQEMLLHQLACANHIVVNKMDLVQQCLAEEVKKNIRNKNNSAHIEIAEFGNINFEQFLTRISSAKHIKQLSTDKEMRQKTSYSSMSTLVLPNDRPLSKSDIEHFLTKHASQIIRAKGFVQIFEDGKTTPYLVQYSGVKRVEWSPEYAERYFFILIGIDLDTITLKREWLQMVGSQTNWCRT
ncbi:GTP-binding protein [Bacillus sp. ISL-53]|nr:GTP-binding protein [Bacillus sp. ISL-53]